jgi:4-hydroxy-3-methylbut-2-enyl diphosphate reductase
MPDAMQIVCDYIMNGGDKAAFMERFKKAVSPGFDPEAMLVKVSR